MYRNGIYVNLFECYWLLLTIGTSGYCWGRVLTIALKIKEHGIKSFLSVRQVIFQNVSLASLTATHNPQPSTAHPHALLSRQRMPGCWDGRREGCRRRPAGSQDMQDRIVLSASLRMKYEQEPCEKCGHWTAVGVVHFQDCRAHLAKRPQPRPLSAAPFDVLECDSKRQIACGANCGII